MRLGAVGCNGLIITGTRESGPTDPSATAHQNSRSSIVASTFMGSKPGTLLNSSELWNARFRTDYQTEAHGGHSSGGREKLFFRSGGPALRIL